MTVMKRIAAVFSLALCAVLSGHAGESPVDFVGKQFPTPSMRKDIRIVRDVMPGQMVHLKFRVTSEKHQSSPIKLVFDFFDVDGYNCQRKGLDVSFPTRYIPPEMPVPRVGEDFEVKRIAPPSAVAVRVSLRNTVNDKTAKVEAFDFEVRSPSVCELLLHPGVWWRYMPWLAVVAFMIVFVIGFRRLMAQESTLKTRIRGVSAVAIVALFVAYATWCLGDVIGSDHTGVIKFFAGFALLLFLLYTILDGFGEDSFVSRHPVLFLSIMSMAVHIAVIVFCNRYFHQQMASDSYRAQQCLEAGAIRVGHVGNLADFAYWCNFELLLSIIGIVFGPHLYVGQVINALCCVGMFYPVYELSRSIANKKAALFVVVAMACYPTNYFHSTLLIGEYPSAFMVCWAMWFMLRTLQVGVFSRRGFLYALVCGCILGISQLIKPVSTIMLTAMVLCFLASIVGSGGRQVLNNAVVVLAVVGSFVFVTVNGQEAFREIAKPYEIGPGRISMFTRVLAVGLDVKGRGINTKALVRRYWGSTEEKRRRDVYESLRKDYVHYPVLGAEKFDRVYATEEGLRRWFNLTIGKRCIPEFYIFVENYYYLFRILAFLGAIGFAMSCFARRISDQVFTIDKLMALFLFGFSVLMLISEAQGRYRVPTVSVSFAMIAYIHVVARKCMDVFRRVVARFEGRLRPCKAQGAK